MSKNIWTEEEEKKLKELALEKNIYEIIDYFGGKFTQDQIQSKKAYMGIKTQPIPLDLLKNRLYVNQHFFDDIDTKEKAYVLGYWIADGHMSGTKYGSHIVAFTSKEKNQLELVKKLMDAEQKISSHKNRNCYALSINSKLLHAALKNLGFDNHKSHTAIFPDVSDNLKSHLIRGIFDGDGCISRNGGQKKKKKLSVNFIGTEHIIKSIIKTLNIDVNFKERNNYWSVTYYCSKAFKVLDYIYQNSEGLRLERKYKRYQDAINKTGFYQK